MDALLLAIVAAGGYYLWSKSQPSATPLGPAVVTPTNTVANPQTSTDAAVQNTMAAAAAQGITVNSVVQKVVPVSSIPPGGVTPVVTNVTVTTANPNPGDPTNVVQLISPDDMSRLYGNYVPNPPTPAPGSYIAKYISSEGIDLRTALGQFSIGQAFDYDANQYRMQVADWNWFRHREDPSMPLLDQISAGPAWGHNITQAEYLDGTSDPAHFQSNYAGTIWS